MIKFGLLLTKIERGLHPQRLACEAEASGFDSFYLPENSHVPLIRPGTKNKIDNIEVKKINDNKYRLLVGPFENFNALKKTYISLNNLGFEDLNIYRE